MTIPYYLFMDVFNIRSDNICIVLVRILDPEKLQFFDKYAGNIEVQHICLKLLNYPYISKVLISKILCSYD